MADSGFKVSKAGFDVKTCDDKNLVFSSSLNMFKVAAIGETSTTYSHGLGYAPTFFAAGQISATKYGLIGQDFTTGAISSPTTTTTIFDADGKTTKYYLFHQQS